MSINYSGDYITFPDGTKQASAPVGMKNRIINGSMTIDQRNAGASVSVSSNTYTLDRYRSLCGGGSGAYSVQQSSTAPVGFTKSMLMTVTTTVSSPASTAYFSLRQSVEGYNIADLGWGTANAKTVTLSFWVRSSLTGQFGGSINNDNDTSYPFSYTISSANTWEQKSITVAGPTTGTWATDNSIGLNVEIALGAGSSRTGTAGSWSTGTVLFTSTGSTNVMATNGATFYITGVQLEAGASASSFDYRPYGTELALCQRYYWKYQNNYIVTGFNENSSGFLAAFTLPTQMRTGPTMGTDASATYRIRIPGATVTVTSLSGDSATVSSLRIVGNTSGGLTAGQGSILVADTNRFLDFSAEL